MEVGEASVAYRTMVVSAANLPECGVGNRRRPTLGVRPGIDVVPDADGIVAAGGGMSVAPSPDVLPPHYRPVEHGGTSILPCCALDLSTLPQALQHVATSATHGVIGNTEAMAIVELQTTLCSTAPNWTPILAEGST